MPSHKTRWTEEEDQRLKEALARYSYGNWKLISEYVKTRNPLQYDNMSISHEITGTEQKDIPDRNRDEEMPLIEYKEAVLDNQDKILDNEDNAPYNEDNEPNNEEKVSSNEEKAPSNEGKVPDNQDETPDNKETILGNEETVPNEIKRESESLFSPYVITEDEKFNNPEWFRQKHSKTPDRYLKIRNHMLACWEQCKPRYLTKTSARKGLKDCGDVNAIGRVHEYLESIGAININCVTSAPRPPKRTFREKLELDDKDMFDAAELVIGYDGPRKRKVRNEHGDWVDPKELEGRVIEHDQVITRLDSKPKRIMKRSPHHHYYGGDDFGRGHDPFRLVPTLHYDEETPAPFEVEIVSDALLVMDFHSHLAHTEIIGLLGGNFIRRGESKILQVKTVFPCQSTSTGIQCEMDPASEMKARDEFAEKGFNVVGWYHSHPTFEPHPSIRDIENQTSYQTLFREEKTGDEPFIGVI
ncbi:Myb-like, SWIRM and MPN domains 1, partial [Rhizopus stolonifer]